MGFWNKLIGGLIPESKPIPKKEVLADPSKDPNLIQVFDAYGREMFITKEAWRKDVLPGTIKLNWNNPDQLAGIVIGSLNDGFFADMLDAAEQLHRIDSEPARGACVYGIVLMKNDRLKEAEKVFRNYIGEHGEDGSVLTNLAKVYSARKDEQKAEEILWHALEVDPNQENGLAWYCAIQNERQGEEAGREALRRIAALPGSWRAQLWLARELLQTRKQEEALALYRECLARVTKPIPTDLLTQMSGDLGTTGHLPEILQMVEPHFDVQAHGLKVGNNLIKAHLDLGQIDAARRIIDRLYAQKRPDWKEALNFWEQEIAKTHIATSRGEHQDIKMALLTIEAPVWLKPASTAAELFPVKSQDPTIIAFLGSSAEVATNSNRPHFQMADNPGRLSRALPLFLAEHVELSSSARAQTLVPWITDGQGGFILAGRAWTSSDAANYSRHGNLKSDYVVITHLVTVCEPWSVELRLVRSIDGQQLGTLYSTFASTALQDGIPQLAKQLLSLLREQAELEVYPTPPFYRVPTAGQFPFYLLRLEQLLAVRCGGMDGVPAGHLSGEREIIEGNIHLCAECADCVCTRLLLAQTLLSMKRVRPDILAEFKEKIALLQKEKPLVEPAQGIVQRLFTEAYGA